MFKSSNEKGVVRRGCEQWKESKYSLCEKIWKMLEFIFSIRRFLSICWFRRRPKFNDLNRIKIWRALFAEFPVDLRKKKFFFPPSSSFFFFFFLFWLPPAPRIYSSFVTAFHHFYKSSFYILTTTFLSFLFFSSPSLFL